MHLHAWVETISKVSISDKFAFDLYDKSIEKRYHGKYEGCRSNKDVVVYVTKDANYISNMTLEQIEAQKQARVNKTSVIGELALKEGRLTAAMVRDMPGKIITGNL